MTVVPLPDTPCVRVRVSGNHGTPGEWGNRFYLSYSGSAPSGANCSTLAGEIATAWVVNISPLQNPEWLVEEVDVLDIATDTGLSGQSTFSDAGTRTGTPLPDQCAMVCEFGIARRYRGGKPRMFILGGNIGDLTDPSSFGSTVVTEIGTRVAAFFAAVEALSVGSMGTLQHVNLSYYKGFTNLVNSSGRERAVPTYRSVALHDNVTGYFGKATVGSQKRRRTSSTP